jgi:hypothetical protein
MLSRWVVEHLDVIEHVLSRLFARFVRPALYPLTLEHGQPEGAPFEARSIISMKDGVQIRSVWI